MRFSTLIAAAGVAAPVLAAGDKGPSKPGHGGKLVSSKELIKDIKLKDLLAGSQKLQDQADAHGGNRAFGGGGHNATTEWLYQTLKKTGYYNVYKQPFVELFTAATVNLTAGGSTYHAEYMTYGPSGDVTAPLIAASNLGCTAADFPADTTGKIALIKRGECTFAIKALNAKAAGAVGAVIYNNVAGNLAGTLGAVGDYAPTVGTTQQDGETLLAAVGAGPVEATVFVNSIQENRTNYNVIAETKQGDHDNVLVLGGHSDSVFAGPGINDDGSGTIGVLTVAKALTKYKVKNAVRFAFWGAEEFGKLGSFYYLKSINGTLGGGPEEVAKMRAYLNFDMIASPNYVLGIYDGDGSAFNFSGPTGSGKIEKDFEEFYESRGLPHVPSLFTLRSDYAAFLENGIPSGGLFTGAEVAKTPEEAQLFGGEAGVALDICYHQACDNMDNLNHEAYLLNSQSIANSVGKYAVSWDGIPKPTATLRKRSAEKARLLSRFDDGHSHTHAHGQPCGAGDALL